MEKEKSENIAYLSKIFKRLPTERKDGILKTARQLLMIQNKDTFSMLSEKPIPQNVFRES